MRGMNRRRFFESLLGGAIAAHQLDIDKLLWVPGEKTIFIPPHVETFTGLTPNYYSTLLHPMWSVEWSNDLANWSKPDYDDAYIVPKMVEQLGSADNWMDFGLLPAEPGRLPMRYARLTWL